VNERLAAYLVLPKDHPLGLDGASEITRYFDVLDLDDAACQRYGHGVGAVIGAEHHALSAICPDDASRP